MREFLVFQSLWAMQDHRGQCELSLEAQLEKIAAAGFDGVTDHFCLAQPAARLHNAESTQSLMPQANGSVASINNCASALRWARPRMVGKMRPSAPFW